MQAPAHDGLRIAISAHLLSGQDSYRSAGVHQYIRQLLRHLSSIEEDDMHFIALLGPEAPEPNLPSFRSRWDTGRPVVRIVWEQGLQPGVLRQIEADLVHAPVFVGPLFTSCPVVTTIHDLSFIRFPDLFRPLNRLYLTVMTRLSARRVRRLIAVSGHAASEAADLLGVSRDQIDVIYHGVDPAFQLLPVEEVEAFRERQGLPRQFVLFVGTLEPRKNLVRLIDAFARVRNGQTHLVLVGGRGWFCDDLFARVEELDLGAAVLFPGYVRSEELPLWYNAATAFAYPSLYEGFGMPVTEAQACGTPVLTSTTSSLPEAAGQAALFVNPVEVDEIASGLGRLLGDDALRGELRDRGLAHAREFRWARTAKQTADVYRRALAEGIRGEPQ